MYRGEVVRTGGGESRPADPISQSDKLKLYLVINMILCEIISAWNGMRVSENICSPLRELNERQWSVTSHSQPSQAPRWVTVTLLVSLVPPDPGRRTAWRLPDTLLSPPARQHSLLRDWELSWSSQPVSVSLGSLLARFSTRPAHRPHQEEEPAGSPTSPFIWLKPSSSSCSQRFNKEIPKSNSNSLFKFL